MKLQKLSPPKNCTTSLAASPQAEPNARNFQPAFQLSDFSNLFSEFFQNKVSKIRSDLDSQTRASHSLGKPFGGVPLLSFMPISGEKKKQTVSEILSKTCDLDPIPSSLLFECLDTILR